MSGSPVAGLVRGWVGLYTRGLPADARAARRDEIADDLWCQHAEAAAAGRSARSLDADLALRLLFGMPADVSWRMTFRAERDPAILERSASMSSRILGVLAIVAASSLGSLTILAGAIGEDALWGWGGTMIVLVGSMIALMAVALGLGFLFQDRLGLLGAVGAILVTLGSTLIVIANLAGLAILPVGSAMLMWDLGRIGVLSRRASTAHVAAAAILVIGLAAALRSQTDVALGLVGTVTYELSWIAIGVSLLRGVPRAQATSGSPTGRSGVAGQDM